jgi:putative transposase
MYVERSTGEVYGLNRIARIKRKFGLITEKRRPNKIKQALNKYIEHKTSSNILEQQFVYNQPDKAYSTDVTYLTNYKGRKACLSGVKDLCTKEIVGWEISETNGLSFVIDSVRKALQNVNPNGLIIHSDQGYQYTHTTYQTLLRSKNVVQSMSRRGNCYDNAPIESFFGQLKDECDYKKWEKIEDLKRIIRKYIQFYNNKRPQWSLKRKTPVEYRSYIS